MGDRRSPVAVDAAACAMARELVPWVAAGAAPAADRAWLYHHVAGCRRCRADLARTAGLVLASRAGVRALPRIPDGAWPRLETGFGDAPAPIQARAGERGAATVVDATLAMLELAGLPLAVSRPVRWALGWR